MGMSGINLNQLTDQLKNMKQEDIDEATDTIRNMLGTNDNGAAGELISDMLTNIRDELQNEDISSGNPLNNIVKLAENVANKMKPKMDNSDVNVEDLFKSTKNLTDNCVDENGNNIFGNGLNPFAMMNTMMNSADPKMAGIQAMMGQMLNNSNGGQPNINPNDMLIELNKMNNQMNNKK